MQPKERLALATLLGVTILGHAVRLVASAPTAAPGGFRLISGPPPGDVALHRARSARADRPVRAGERIDLNSAPVAEISRLPRVGIPLAKAIVAARTESGGFLGFSDLDRVEGVGPGLIRTLDSLVTFGDTVRIRARRGVEPGRDPVPIQGTMEAPGRGGQPVVWEPRKRGRSGAAGDPVSEVKIHLNSASQNDLERLPGIGPTRARAILAYRQSNGPFASVADLSKVPGMPRRLVTQLAPQVVIP
jgi:competence protein ComEA